MHIRLIQICNGFRHVLEGNIGVEVGGRCDGAMTEGFLYDSQVVGLFEQSDGEGVSRTVDSEMLESRPGKSFRPDFIEALRPYRSTLPQEESSFTPLADEFFKVLDQLWVERENVFGDLAFLQPADGQEAASEVNVFDVDGGDFGNSQARPQRDIDEQPCERSSLPTGLLVFMGFQLDGFEKLLRFSVTQVLRPGNHNGPPQFCEECPSSGLICQ